MKLEELQSYLEYHNIHLTFLTHTDSNLTYFTQMEPSHGFLLIKPKSANFMISKLDKKPRLQNITTSILEKGWKEKLSDSKIKRIGINKQNLTVAMMDTINEIYPKSKLIDISEKLAQLRQAKNAQELNCIGKACTITSQAFKALQTQLPKLQTEQDIAFFLEKFIKSKGASLAFPTIVAMGKNAAVPHHITSNSKLQRGFLLLDFGARYKNYCADMSRMLFLGKPTKEEKQWYNLLLNSQRSALDAVKEGINYSKLDKVARSHLKEYSKNFIHSLGHGIGIEVHESPVFSEQTALVRSHVPFTIEPGLYFPNQFGLRIEDTVYWDGKKVVILTKASKKLQSVPWEHNIVE